MGNHRSSQGFASVSTINNTRLDHAQPIISIPQLAIYTPSFTETVPDTTIAPPPSTQALSTIPSLSVRVDNAQPSLWDDDSVVSPVVDREV